MSKWMVVFLVAGVVVGALQSVLLAQDEAVARASEGLEAAKDYVSKGGSVDGTDMYGEALLFLAASKEKREVVLYLMEQGAKVDVRGQARQSKGRHFLYHVVNNGWLEVLKKALPKMASEVRRFNFRTFRVSKPEHFHDGTMFFVAVAKGRLGIVKHLESKGLKIKTRALAEDGSKTTDLAIHRAAAAGRLEIVKHLHKKGMSIRAKTYDGNEPVHLAAENNKTSVMDYLFANGVPVNVRNVDGMTPVLMNQKGTISMHFLRYWMGHGADLYAVANPPKKIIVITNQSGSVTYKPSADRPASVIANVVKEGRLELLKEMVSMSFNYSQKDHKANSLLNLAAKHRSHRGDLMKYLEYLIGELRMEARDKNEDGVQPMHNVAGNLTALKYLEKNGANLKERDNNGNLVLHYAASHSRGISSIRYLVEEKGMNVNTTNKSRETPLLLAAKYGRPENLISVIEYLVDQGAWININRFAVPQGETVLHWIVQQGDPKNTTYVAPIADYLLAKGAKVNLLNNERKSPLHYAAEKGHLEIVRALLARGARVSPIDKHRKTPLVYALENAHVDVSRDLIEASKRMVFNAKYTDGNTLVHLLASYPPMSLAAALSELGGSRDGRSVPGGGVEQINKNFQSEMVALIHAKGARLNSANSNGMYPIHLAARSGNVELLTTLVLNKVRLDQKDGMNRDALYHAVKGAEALVGAEASLGDGQSIDLEGGLARYETMVADMLRTKVFNRASVALAIQVARKAGLENLLKQLAAAQ